MEETITDIICTRCIKNLRLDPLLKYGADSVNWCDICKNKNRCCFELQRSIKSSRHDETRYNHYLRITYSNNHHFYFNKRSIKYEEQMWKHGVEYEMKFMLRIICCKMRRKGIDVPVEVVRIIYDLVGKITYWKEDHRMIVYRRKI